ncbi:PREDICTED: uncharacterized protein LOC108545213 [Eufriesea mexicana]|uniref:uncharacterized protein LOC108545213 n=1 Tax=Eufriesea mexicana TaxID=516756 RepID=UPI00083BAE54|nr:PREDICTED: uncharacterized protein LOC108545213 [Eufriesea mexicana]
MMSRYRYEYKKNMSNSRNIIENRFNRAKKQNETRRNQRVDNFNANRKLSSPSPKIRNRVQPIHRNDDRSSKFTKWRDVRDKRTRLDQAKKKPPFVVGVVHHKIYSPINKSVSAVSTRKRSSIPKRITKATEKKLMTKVSAMKVNTKGLINDKKALNKGQGNQRIHGQSSISDNSKIKLSRTPLSPTVVIEKLSPTKITPSVSKIWRIPSKNKSTSPKNSSVVLSNTFNHDSKLSIKSKSVYEPMVFHRISNYKRSNTNGKQQYDSCLSHSTNDIPTKGTVMESLNISVQEDKLSTQYFQSLLKKETNRLNKLCQKWMKVKTAPETPHDGQCQINQAIGQTNLLITKKFEKFRELIIACEAGEGEMLVTCKDLQGFWDMMYMEVKNCDSRFEKLEKLCSQGWKEEEVPEAVSKKKTIVRKKVVSNKTNPIRAFLAEKKRKVAGKVRNGGDTNELQSNLNQVVNNRSIKDRSYNLKRKTRSMFIGPSENKATLMKRDKRLSLVQKIRLSERSKKIDSPLTIMKISRMCKTPKVQLHNFKPYVKSNQTPGKGILKQRKSPTKVESPEFINKVNFDDHTASNKVLVDEKIEEKKNLAVIISKLNSSDADCFDQVSINAKKKLAFDDNSSEEPISNTEQHVLRRSSTNKKIHKLPFIRIQSATPLKESNENISTPRRSTRRKNIGYEDNQTINQTSPLDANISMLFEETTNDTDLNISEKEIQKNVSVTGKKEVVEYNDNIRVLRNRIVTPVDTPIIKRRSGKMSMNIQDVKHKENKPPLSRRTTMNAFQDNVDDNERMDADNYADITHFEKDNSKRRSTRYIKFSVKEYTDHNTDKPTLPVTPYIRSKAHSNTKERLWKELDLKPKRYSL